MRSFCPTVERVYRLFAPAALALGLLTGPAWSEVLNFSVRGNVAPPGPEQLSGDFIVGAQGARLVLRSNGPSLVEHGVERAVRDPRLMLYAAGQTLIAANDDWVDAPEAEAIERAGLAPVHVYESALIETLPPGTYSMVVESDSPGIGMAGMVKLSGDPGAIINFSGRGVVGKNGASLIVAFIVVDTPSRVLIRARGPSLHDHGVQETVQADPMISLFAGNDLIATNDDWRDDPEAAAVQSLGLAPADDRESALLRTLEPGRYGVVVEGEVPGIAVVGVFDLDQSAGSPAR